MPSVFGLFLRARPKRSDDRDARSHDLGTIDTTTSSDGITTSYKKLIVSAAALNSASDELGKFVSALDASLKRLNLGISTWVKIAGDTDDHCGDYWERNLGYAKVGGRWGIALRTEDGNVNYPPAANVEQWLFNDAPRALRVEGAPRIPDLLDELIKKADDTTAEIEKETGRVREFAEAVNALRSQPAQQQRK